MIRASLLRHLVATTLVATSLMLLAPPAHAWNTLTCSTNPSYRVAWPGDDVWPIRFFSNAPTGSWLRSQLEGGMVDWNTIYGAYDVLLVNGGGYNYCTSSEGEGFGVAGWDDGACHSWGPGEEGVTLAWTTNCIVNRMSLYINAGAFISGDDHLRYIANHELGHYVGGGHEWYELTTMGYSSDHLTELTAPDHLLLRWLYGSGNSGAPDLYLSKLGLVDFIIPDAVSFEELPAPTCSGSCSDLQPGDTISVEVTYGNAGQGSAFNAPIEMRLGGVTIGAWTWTANGEAQTEGIFTGTVPSGMPTGSQPLELVINPGFTISEQSGPTPPNSLTWFGFTVAPPAGWTCSAFAYADGFYCDCDCGVADPDCDDDDAPVFGCAPQTCMNASCGAFGDCLYNYASGSCSDGAWCTVVDTCSLGDCVGTGERDCSAEDGPCSEGVCDEGADQCAREAINEGQACDDGLFCTVTTTCSDSYCTGGPRDCSGAGDQCNVGSCDDAADSCVPQPSNEGGACDDGDLCTDGDSCANGSCAGVAKDCSHLAGPCEVAFCDAATGDCVVEPKDNGTPCQDGDFCSVGDTCQAGVCSAGPARDCSAAGDTCNQGVCDEIGDSCAPQPSNEGGTCDDNDLCTPGDVCAAGQCEGAPTDCSALDDQCNLGVCNGSDGTCVAEPANIGQACDDALLCTPTSSCTAAGTCEGAEIDCAQLAGPCEIAFCDAATGSCVVEPAAEGAACEDGDFCTVMDSCSAGICVGGGPRDCAAAGDTCNLGVCDEAADSCVPQPTNDGGACDDGDLCTLEDSCAAGQCTGAPTDCSALDDQCNAGVCDAADGTCTTAPAHIGDSCDDGDLCTPSSTCSAAGVCEGADKDCSLIDGPCTVGACNSESGECFAVGEPDGSTCSDGNPCTTGDTCFGGACTPGGALDCSDLDSACGDGVCDPEAGACIVAPENEGGACDDGDLCTRADACEAGVCVGGDVPDCTDLDSPCGAGVCDPATGGCSTESFPNGVACVDDPCMTRQRCSDGACEGGEPVDCSLYDDTCVEGVCNPDTGNCYPTAIDNCEEEPPAAGCSHVAVDVSESAPVSGVVLLGLAGLLGRRRQLRRRRRRLEPS